MPYSNRILEILEYVKSVEKGNKAGTSKGQFLIAQYAMDSGSLSDVLKNVFGRLEPFNRQALIAIIDEFIAQDMLAEFKMGLLRNTFVHRNEIPHWKLLRDLTYFELEKQDYENPKRILAGLYS